MFGALWVGNDVPLLQRICFNSFVKNGHPLSLFVYNKYDLPKEIVQIDANEIVPSSQIFTKSTTFGESYAQFSDIFRYQMLKKRPGMIWVDADTICHSNDLTRFTSQKYLFLEESRFGGTKEKNFVGGILRLPSKSDFLKNLIKKSSMAKDGQIRWSETGPDLITEYVKRNELETFAIRETEIFFPKWNSKVVFDSTRTKEIEADFKKHKYPLTVLWGSSMANEGHVLSEENAEYYDNTFIGRIFAQYG